MEEKAKHLKGISFPSQKTKESGIKIECLGKTPNFFRISKKKYKKSC